MSVFMGATTKPFQFVEVISFSAMVLGGLGMLGAVIARQWFWALLGLSFGLWGLTTTIICMVGEYLVRMNYEMGRKPKYLIRRTHE